MQLKGKLSEYLQGILERITEVRQRCELAIDFADQDLPRLTWWFGKQIAGHYLRCAELPQKPNRAG
jgi:tRNA U34 5-carboxymethylaminomethyl modifying GTPase MnmE/TrmE